jgi:hypothetical protein
MELTQGFGNGHCGTEANVELDYLRVDLMHLVEPFFAGYSILPLEV